MKGHALFQGEIITKLRKYILEIIRNLIFKNNSANFNQIQPAKSILEWRELKSIQIKALWHGASAYNGHSGPVTLTAIAERMV